VPFCGATAQKGLSRFVPEVSRSHAIQYTYTHTHTHAHTHTHTHTYNVEFLLTNDQPLAEATSYTAHNKHKGQTYILSSGIRTRDFSNQTATDLHLRPQDHLEQRLYEYVHRHQQFIY